MLAITMTEMTVSLQRPSFGSLHALQSNDHLQRVGLVGLRVLYHWIGERELEMYERRQAPAELLRVPKKAKGYEFRCRRLITVECHGRMLPQVVGLICKVLVCNERATVCNDNTTP